MARRQATARNGGSRSLPEGALAAHQAHLKSERGQESFEETTRHVVVEIRKGTKRCVLLSLKDPTFERLDHLVVVFHGTVDNKLRVVHLPTPLRANRVGVVPGGGRQWERRRRRSNHAANCGDSAKGTARKRKPNRAVPTASRRHICWRKPDWALFPCTDGTRCRRTCACSSRLDREAYSSSSDRA